MIAAVVSTALLLSTNVAQLRDYARIQRKRDAMVRNEILAAAALVRGGAPYIDQSQPAPPAPNLHSSELRVLVRSGWLTIPHQVDPAATLAEQARLQVALDPAGIAPPSADKYGVVPVGAVAAQVNGCLRVTPTSNTPSLALGPLTTPGTLVLTLSQAGRVRVQLIEQSPPRTSRSGWLKLSPHQPHSLVLLATGVRVSVELPRTATTVCG